MANKKIALVLVYLGKLPLWIDGFLVSCAYNETLDWLIFTDDDLPAFQPSNVQFIETNLNELKQLITEKAHAPSIDNPIKFCDFKVCYGHFFEDYLTSYDYWGHCDLDIIFGNLSGFLSRINFEAYDIISSRENVISGHFTLYRNTKSLNHLYQKVPRYNKVFETSEHLGFDEGAFSYYLFGAIESRQENLRVFWNGRNCIDRAELQRMPNGWYWKHGKIKHKWGKEGTYLHLIDWKKSLINAAISTPKTVNHFKINRLGLWEKSMPWIYRKKLMTDHGWRQQFAYLKSRLYAFIKFQLLGKKKQQLPNVLPQYRTL